MQIKVKDTRMHKTNKIHEGVYESVKSNNEVRVVEGKLVRCFKPIIISETEEIQEGDWYYVEDIKRIYSTNNTSIKFFEGKHKKVLALSEHFSSKHLQAIVDGKMKEGDTVLLETEHTKGEDDYYGHRIKFNSSNHITLHKNVNKTYTKKEIISLCKAAFEIGRTGKINFRKWLNNNMLV